MKLYIISFSVQSVEALVNCTYNVVCLKQLRCYKNYNIFFSFSGDVAAEFGLKDQDLLEKMSKVSS